MKVAHPREVTDLEKCIIGIVIAAWVGWLGCSGDQGQGAVGDRGPGHVREGQTAGTQSTQVRSPADADAGVAPAEPPEPPVSQRAGSGSADHRSKLVGSHALPTSLREVVLRAELICHGRVTRVESARERYDETAELVMSRIGLEPSACWKGAAPSRGTLEFRSFGGHLDGVAYFDEIFPLFHLGEEVVVFLRGFKGGLFPVEHRAGKMAVKGGVVVETGKAVENLRSEVLRLGRE